MIAKATFVCLSELLTCVSKQYKMIINLYG
jgi:hypothetical protein